MIPKIIHYIWVGGKPLTPLAEKCIESWEKYCPDYEIKRWDESNFDINKNDYCREAYESKKWAFVSDFIRVSVLHEYGGIYLDTDVEIIKSLDNFLNQNLFFGLERENAIATCVIGAEKENLFIKSVLDSYKDRHFVLENGQLDLTTNVVLISNQFCLMHNVSEIKNKTTNYDGVTIYSSDYFSPIDYDSKEMNLTKNTHTIHHFAGSWVEKPKGFKKYIIKLKSLIKKIIGKKNTERIIACRKKKREQNEQKK